MQPAPSRLAPIFDRRLWGMRNLDPLFPEMRDQDPPIAEAWLTGEQCVFASGPYGGRKLGEAWPAMPVEWKGTRCLADTQIPLLAKFLFPGDKPSIQVHPDDAYAAKHEFARGGRGKTEMWHLVSARAGAEMLVGLRPGVSPETFRGAIADGTLEDLLEHIPVRAGDSVFVPAGTVHTVGAGVTLCEIQEQSDITYRVYDYKRKDADGKERPLQVDQALAVIRFGEQSGGRIVPVRMASKHLMESWLVACRYFAVEKWLFDVRIGGVTSPQSFELLIFLSGTGAIEWGGHTEEYARAQAWMLPAALGPYRLAPSESSSLLRAYVPNLDEVARQLTDRGIPAVEWARMVFP